MTKEELDDLIKQIKAATDVTDLQNISEKLATQVYQAKDAADRFKRSIGESVKLIGEGDNLFKSIGYSLQSSAKALYSFTSSLTQQYKLSEQLAKSYKQTSVNIGIGYKNQKILSNEFNRAVVLVEQLGGEMDDVKGIYTKFSQESGRVRILDEEEVQRIFAIERATGLLGDSATALAERFDLMGVGSEQFADNINQIVKDSQKIGLNSSKVVQVLSDNFESMQRMSFKGGVKAMTEMSKLAVKMRMNISDMLGMADRFYEPEAAIEAAANLQLLGGEIANSFGDPLQMMFEARNAPEELMKRVGDVTQGLVKFNEETGQFDMLAENRQKLIGMADALGINKDQLIDTAFQMNKMQKIKMDVGGNLFDEDTMDKISSLAKFDKTSGQWTVDISGQAVPVEDLNTEQIEQALATPTTEEDAIIETAKASMTTNEHLEALVQSSKTSIANETRLYERIEKLATPTIDNMKKPIDETVQAFSEAIKTVDIETGISESFTKGSDLFNIGVNTFSNVVGDFAGIVKNELQSFTSENFGVNKTTGKNTNINAQKRAVATAKNVSNVSTSTAVQSTPPLLMKQNVIPASTTTNLQNQINKPQQLSVGGTINFSPITVTTGTQTSTTSLTPAQQKELNNNIQQQIMQGVNNILNGGYPDGKTANTGVGGNM